MQLMTSLMLNGEDVMTLDDPLEVTVSFSETHWSPEKPKSKRQCHDLVWKLNIGPWPLFAMK